MISECPHCHRRVLPLASGECPSCHKNVADTTGVNIHETMLPVSEATKFPAVCCSCGEATTNVVKIIRSGRMAGVAARTSDSSMNGAWPAVYLFNPIAALFALVFATALGKNQAAGEASLTIRVPQCKSCAAKSVIDVPMVDLEHARLGIIVSRRFAEASEAMNRR